LVALVVWPGPYRDESMGGSLGRKQRVDRVARTVACTGPQQESATQRTRFHRCRLHIAFISSPTMTPRGALCQVSPKEHPPRLLGRHIFTTMAEAAGQHGSGDRVACSASGRPCALDSSRLAGLLVRSGSPISTVTKGMGSVTRFSLQREPTRPGAPSSTRRRKLWVATVKALCSEWEMN
jgi:hypothetical protein